MNQKQDEMRRYHEDGCGRNLAIEMRSENIWHGSSAKECVKVPIFSLEKDRDCKWLYLSLEKVFDSGLNSLARKLKEKT